MCVCELGLDPIRDWEGRILTGCLKGDDCNPSPSSKVVALALANVAQVIGFVVLRYADRAQRDALSC